MIPPQAFEFAAGALSSKVGNPFGGGSSGPSWADKRAGSVNRKKKNAAATDYSGLAGKTKGLLDRYAAWAATGDTNMTERLGAKLTAAGVDMSKFGDKGSADAAYLKLAGGGPVFGKTAAFLRNNSNVASNLAEAEKTAGIAETAIPDDINQSFQSTLNQIAALTGGNPNSPAVQAAAAQVLAQRFGSLDRAKLDIQQNLSSMKIGIRNQGNEFDVGLLSSIGDTIEMLRAQKEADQMAKYQMAAGIGGGVASLGLGIAGLMGGGAGAAASGATRGQTVMPAKVPTFQGGGYL